MADKFASITVQVDIESGQLLDVIESLVRQSFEQGYAHGRHQEARRKPFDDRVPVEQVYTDWRGWGPGATLPGGSAFRAAQGAESAVDYLRRVCSHNYSDPGDGILVCVTCGDSVDCDYAFHVSSAHHGDVACWKCGTVLHD